MTKIWVSDLGTPPRATKKSYESDIFSTGLLYTLLVRYLNLLSIYPLPIILFVSIMENLTLWAAEQCWFPNPASNSLNYFIGKVLYSTFITHSKEFFNFLSTYTSLHYTLTPPKHLPHIESRLTTDKHSFRVS